jgi:hypothetical protein
VNMDFESKAMIKNKHTVRRIREDNRRPHNCVWVDHHRFSEEGVAIG